MLCGNFEQGGERTAHGFHGIYLRVLYALQLDDDILLLAKEDKLGREACHITRSPEESKQRIVAHLCKILPVSTDEESCALILDKFS